MKFDFRNGFFDGGALCSENVLLSGISSVWRTSSFCFSNGLPLGGIVVRQRPVRLERLEAGRLPNVSLFDAADANGLQHPGTARTRVLEKVLGAQLVFLVLQAAERGGLQVEVLNVFVIGVVLGNALVGSSPQLVRGQTVEQVLDTEGNDERVHRNARRRVEPKLNGLRYDRQTAVFLDGDGLQPEFLPVVLHNVLEVGSNGGGQRLLAFAPQRQRRALRFAETEVPSNFSAVVKAQNGRQKFRYLERRRNANVRALAVNASTNGVRGFVHGKTVLQPFRLQHAALENGVLPRTGGVERERQFVPQHVFDGAVREQRVVRLGREAVDGGNGAPVDETQKVDGVQNVHLVRVQHQFLDRRLVRRRNGRQNVHLVRVTVLVLNVGTKRGLGSDGLRVVTSHANVAGRWGDETEI